MVTCPAQLPVFDVHVMEPDGTQCNLQRRLRIHRAMKRSMTSMPGEPRTTSLPGPGPRRSIRPWLATEDGLVLRQPPVVLPRDAEEIPMRVSFEGLTPKEQRAALAAFPGGRRFVLVG